MGRKQLDVEQISTEFFNLIDICENEFDLFVELYLILMEHSQELRILENNGKLAYEWCRIEARLRELLFLKVKNRILYSDDFRDRLKANLKMVIHPFIFAKTLISLFDEFLVIREARYRDDNQYDPVLNTLATRDKGLLLYNSDMLHNFFENEVISNLTNAMHDTDAESPLKILNMKRFYFIPSSQSDYEINVKLYSSSILKIRLNHLRRNEDGTKKKIILTTVLCSLLGEQIIDLNHEVRKGRSIFTCFIKEIEMDKYNQKFQRIIRKLNETGVQIAVFPEMIFTKQMIDDAKLYLKEAKEGSLLLVVCGTIWENYSNRCILLAGDGSEIGTQYKIKPYIFNRKIEIDDRKYEEEWEEDLRENDKKLNLYDINYLGKVCTPICADYIKNSNTGLWESLKADLILVPAYTDSLTSFWQSAKSFAKSGLSCSFIANSCMVADNKYEQNVSFAVIPCKGCSDDQMNRYTPRLSKCSEVKRRTECLHNSNTGCFFTITLEMLDDELVANSKIECYN